MKKVIKKLYTVLYRIFFLFFDFLIDFLFCIRVFVYLRDKEFNEYHIKNIKVLLQFFGRSFDSSSFEYYNIHHEESMYFLYLSLKKKNNLIFQTFCFFYCFIVDYFLYELIDILLPTSNFKNKLIDNTFCLWSKALKNQIENNFGYQYLTEYKIYYCSDREYYNSIKYKVFFFESILNICDSWNKHFIKNNRKSKLFINTDNLFFYIERYF